MYARTLDVVFITLTKDDGEKHVFGQPCIRVLSSVYMYGPAYP